MEQGREGMRECLGRKGEGKSQNGRGEGGIPLECRKLSTR